MKILKSSQTKTYQNSSSCSAIEYPLGDKDINGAIIRINGRYPDHGRMVNEKCKEMAYIIKGSGAIFVEGKQYVFKPGDLLLIDAGEKYYWQGKNLEMFVPCAPAWYPEQHKEVE